MSGPCTNMGDYAPQSLNITLLLISEVQQRKYQTSLDHPAYEVIEKAMEHLTDPAKADLYARMAERVDPRQPLAVVQRLVSDCLYENQREFPHG